MKFRGEPNRTVNYIGLKFTEIKGNEKTCCCDPHPPCSLESAVLIQDENLKSKRIFCFEVSSSSRPRTQEWRDNDTLLEITYNDALQCCPSNSFPATPSGKISLVLRITLSPTAEKTKVDSINNYDSLLSCNPNSKPVVVDVTYKTNVEHIQYIDLQHSKFDCSSTAKSHGLDSQLVPVSNTVTCRLHDISCVSYPGYADLTIDGCVNKGAEQYLQLQATAHGPPECTEWANAISGSVMQLQSDNFTWESPTITPDLNDAGCSFSFRSVVNCPGSKIVQKETEAVELRIVFNCSATELQCGYPGRGICNHTSLKCQCKETCGSLKIRYKGEQCEKDPWCLTDIPWIAIGISSGAFLFAVLACLCAKCKWCRERVSKCSNCCRKGGYQPVGARDA